MLPVVTRVVLAEDNEFVRRGIRKILDKAQDIEVIGEAGDGVEALALVHALKPDILVLDVEMPRLSGIEVAHQMKKNGSKTRILVLSAFDDLQYIRQMLLNGVEGYLIKDEAPERMIEALRGIAQGQRDWVSPKVKSRLKV
jgi:two-component system, NarL family, response regulator DesR